MSAASFAGAATFCGKAPPSVSNGGLTGGDVLPGTGRALHAEGPSSGGSGADAPEDALADRLAVEGDPAVADMVGQVEAMMAAAGSLEELRQMLLAGFDRVDAGPLAEVLGRAMLAGHLGGMVSVLAEEE